MAGSQRVRRATLTAQIEDLLRADIINGVLAPGQRLTASDLTERYEVSATPLREALQRLAAQDLVEIDPRLGASVAPISLEHLRDTYWIRQLLESLAVERSVERGDEEWERRLRQLFADFEGAVAAAGDDPQDDVLSWSRAHRLFHLGLMAACDSPWLLSMLNVVNDHSERYRMLSAVQGVRDPVGEHSAILAAAIARDADAAVSALRLHLDRTVEVIEASLPPHGTGERLAETPGAARGR
jgi:GntR family transcriptional regulator, carbon starvation induced regulator